MSPALSPPSLRLRRAAIIDRGKLLRTRDRLHAQRTATAAKLAELDAQLAAAGERIRQLDEICGTPAPHPDPATATAPRAAGRALRGAAIRETAVRLFAAHPRDALHYRDWYELVCAAGYAIEGKDPLAVFLTAVGRSPVVHRTTTAGVYELDRDAITRLRERADRDRTELAALPTAAATDDPAEIRRRREDLVRAIGRDERALEEALHSLADPAVAAVA